MIGWNCNSEYCEYSRGMHVAKSTLAKTKLISPLYIHTYQTFTMIGSAKSVVGMRMWVISCVLHGWGLGDHPHIRIRSIQFNTHTAYVCLTCKYYCTQRMRESEAEKVPNVQEASSETRGSILDMWQCYGSRPDIVATGLMHVLFWPCSQKPRHHACHACYAG